MPIKVPKPTGEDVSALHAKLVGDWSARFREDEEMRDIIHQLNEVETLEESEERNMTPISMHSGRAGGVIEHARGLVMAQPSWSMDPVSPKSEDKLKADTTEEVCAALFQQQLLANDFWSYVSRDVLSYGRAFLKSLPLPSVWTIQEGYPVRGKKQSAEKYLAKVRDWKEKEGKLPHVLGHVPALNILPLLDINNNVMASIEVKNIMAGVLADKDGMNSPTVRGLIDGGGVKWYDEMMVAEYLDPTYVGYYLINAAPVNQTGQIQTSQVHIDYEELRLWPHGMGKCPVVMIPGVTTELKELRDRFKSFLTDAKESLEMYDFLLSRLATMVWAHYLPSYVWKMSETAAGYAAGGQERPKMKVILGGVTVPYSDEVLEPLPITQNLPDADRLLSEVDDIIQRHTLEDVLFGRVQGSAPAFQVNLRINVARSKLTPIAQHMAQGITNAMDLFFRGVEQLGESVVIEGHEFTVEMAKEAQGRVVASIEPKSPVDRNQDIATAKMALELGKLPWSWIAEKILDIQNSGVLDIEKALEDLGQLPPVQEKLMMELLREYDLLIEEEEYVDAEELGEAAPGELQAALAGLMGEGGGMGRGPWPPGGAPQTVGGGRGLLTENEQPQPRSPAVGTERI